MQRVLVTGADGQLGKALAKCVPPGSEALSANRQLLDVTSGEAVAEWCARHSPTAIINTAAYTAVDKAESEADRAQQVNAVGPANLAQVAARLKIPLVHVSTDFVFNGSQGAPYKPDDTADPLNVYGLTKYQGEMAVTKAAPHAAIVRTAWVYDATGPNFFTTMLRLMKEKDRLSVVADQFGTPTQVDGLASACWQLLDQQSSGIFHWTDAGAASWYDFAVAIQEEARAAGQLTAEIPIQPIPGSDYPTPAKRPSMSVLDKSSTWAELSSQPVHWRAALRRTLASLQHSD